MPALNEMTNYTEYVVEKKVEGSYKTKRLLANIAYILAPIVLIAVLYALAGLIPNKNTQHIIRTGVIAIGLIVGVILYYCNLLPKYIRPNTFKYLQISYEYIIKGGAITFSTLFGEKNVERREIFSKTVSEMHRIAPLSEFKDDPALKKYECVRTMSHPDNYFATFTDTDGAEAVVFFEATEHALKILSFLNKENTVVKKVSI